MRPGRSACVGWRAAASCLKRRVRVVNDERRGGGTHRVKDSLLNRRLLDEQPFSPVLLLSERERFRTGWVLERTTAMRTKCASATRVEPPRTHPFFEQLLPEGIELLRLHLLLLRSLLPHKRPLVLLHLRREHELLVALADVLRLVRALDLLALLADGRLLLALRQDVREEERRVEGLDLVRVAVEEAAGALDLLLRCAAGRAGGV